MTKKYTTVATCDGCGEDITYYGSPTNPSNYRLELRSELRLGSLHNNRVDPLPSNLHFCNLVCLSTWDLRGQMTYDEFIRQGFVDSRRVMERHSHRPPSR